jgi:hypothetical protein
LPPSGLEANATLQVYLLPLGPDRYELFCERPADEGDGEAVPPSTGVWGRLVARFGVMLRAAEDREAQPGARDLAPGLMARLQGRMLSWVAERVAEQRLLWRLRGKATVVAAHPDDVPGVDVIPIAHRLLRSDWERHRRWLIIDVIGLALSGILAIVPGPNMLAYFFAFRVVGHWLSMRGARHGLGTVRWVVQPAPALSSLRGVERMSASARAARLREVAEALGLERLPRFVERLLPRR